MRYSQRPATLAGITDPYTAYCFDEAIFIRGALAERDAAAGVTTVTAHAAKPSPKAQPMTAQVVNGRLFGRISGVIGQRVN